MFFNLIYSFSLLYVRLLSSLSFLHFVSLSLCEFLSTLTLSFCAGGWASTPVDRQWIGGFYGFFFFFLLWPLLKGRGGYGWSGLWVVVLLSPVLLGFVGRQRSPVFRFGVARFLGCSDWWWVWWRSAWITMRSWQRRAWWKWGWSPMGFAMEFWWGKSDRSDFGWILDSAWLEIGRAHVWTPVTV